MCGITGIYNLNGRPVTAQEISIQIDTIIHRGPNQGGLYLSPRGACGLGVRRLSIIDVAGGRQPLSNEDGSIHLVYNGETYNYHRLRRELEQLGHQPRSHSDAEVVLHGYEAWGPKGVLPRLRGMAAFALWDEPRQQLLLARDRFGIKPLYYAVYQDRLYYASEIKAILARPGFPRQINPPALEAMLTLGFVPGPATMFQGIYKLPPAHFLLARRGAFHLQKYWRLAYREDNRLAEEEAIEQFQALLREAVQIRSMSEVPLGALLSGGLDSGAVAALMQAELGAEPRTSPDSGRPKLHTISLGFEQPDYDETAAARYLARRLGTDHHSLIFTTADFDDYPTVMHHLEEPQCSATAVPIYKLYQACRQAGLTVVLTGEGADELLGGYFWHRGDALARLLVTWPAALRRMLAGSPWPMSPAARRVLQRGAKDTPTRYRDWLEVGGEAYRPRLLSPDFESALRQQPALPFLEDWTETLLTGPPAAGLNQILGLETQTRLVDFINFEVDKMSMAHSVEARVPFLDHKLWEFCATVPSGYKLSRRTEKYLLRQAGKSLLPEATRTRRKKGLAAPYASWLRAERLPEWAESALAPDRLKAAGLFNPETVQALRRDHQAGRQNLARLLMGVLSTQLWVDRFMVGS